MLKFCYFLFIFGAAINFKNTYAYTADEEDAFHKYLKPFALECAEELGIDESILEEAKKTKDIDPCFTACLLGKTGLLKDGLIDLDMAEQEMKDFLHDEDEIEEWSGIGRDCATDANESAISDGDKDCKRANIFVTCIKAKKAELA